MDADFQQWLESGGEAFFEAIGVAPGAAVLDFGCRRGTYALPAAKRVGPQGVVHAVDKNQEALDELMRLAAAEGLTNIRRIDTGGGVFTRLADESVDVVLLYDVVHLIGWSEEANDASGKSTASDRRGLYAEMRRVAKPGAMLSVYLQHVDTHTDVGDVGSEARIRDEIESSGFRFEREWCGVLVHDEKLVEGCVFDFRRETACSN
jgi:SAM-dependent methyltransferase